MIVSRDGASLDGIITERDVAVSLAIYDKEFHALPASVLMKTSVITCSPEASIANIARIMTEKRLRHLPVKDGDRLMGVISIGDVLKHRLEEVKLESRVLRDLAIAGR